MLIALAVLVPPLLTDAALLLPRLAGAQGVYQVSKAHKLMSWIGAALFVGAVAYFIHGRARGGEKLLETTWSFALAFAAVEAVYGVYAAWFVQSRVMFDERQARVLREQLQTELRRFSLPQ